MDSGPPTSVTINKDEALKYYNQLQTIRRIEAAAGNLYKEKIVRGFCHLYSGQVSFIFCNISTNILKYMFVICTFHYKEAIAIGITAVIQPVDKVITAYRCHGWTYLMGASIKSVLSELTGRKNGVARGKGGSMHMYATNFYGGNGIVGAQVIRI